MIMYLYFFLLFYPFHLYTNNLVNEKIRISFNSPSIINLLSGWEILNNAIGILIRFLCRFSFLVSEKSIE